jgi:hypothetical protein
MDVEFCMDECGLIQLSYCKNIWIRLLENHKQLKKARGPKGGQEEVKSDVKMPDQDIHK